MVVGLGGAGNEYRVSFQGYGNISDLDKDGGRLRNALNATLNG